MVGFVLVFFARVEICTFHDEDIVHENMLQTLLALSELPYRKWHESNCSQTDACETMGAFSGKSTTTAS